MFAKATSYLQLTSYVVAHDGCFSGEIFRGKILVKGLNVAFEDEYHILLSVKKEELRIILKRERLSWHDYILHISGVRKL